MRKNVCDTCKHFGGERVSGTFGACRVDGPVVSSMAVPGRNDWVGQWPWVRVDDWCGRHSADTDRANMATSVAVGKPSIV